MFKKDYYNTLREYLFLLLMYFTYQDFKALKKPKKIGMEDYELTGALITFHNTPSKRFYDISKSINVFNQPKKLFTKNLELIKKALDGDGGLIIEKDKIISSGVFFDGLIKICKKKFKTKDFEEIVKQYLPAGPINPGNRTRTGLALGLLGRKSSSTFVMNQTVFSNARTGRVIELNGEGTKRTFHLEKNKRKIQGVIRIYKYDKSKSSVVVKDRQVLEEKDLKNFKKRLECFQIPDHCFWKSLFKK
jgi:hypothetical protein